MSQNQEQRICLDDLPDAHVVIGEHGDVLMASTSAKLLAEGTLDEVGALGVTELSFELPLPSGRCLRAEGRVLQWRGAAARVFRISDATEDIVAKVKIQQLERMELLGLLTAGIAHDFNNLLTVVVANAEYLRLSGPLHAIADADDVLRETVNVAQGGARMVQRLLSIGRVEQVAPQPTRMDQLVRETASMIRRLLPRTMRVELRVQGSTSALWALADPLAVQQVLLNLATNARDALTGRADGLLRITVRQRAGSEAVDEFVEVVVADNGAGIPPEALDHVFEPLFTTKSVGRGAGLGLAMVQTIMQEHDGFVRLITEVDVGTQVILAFVACAAGREPDRESLSNPVGGSERVLVVEGDGYVRELTSRVLRQAGYQTDTCADATEALLAIARAKRRGEASFDLVISEKHIEGGLLPLLDAMKHMAPDVPLMLCASEDEGLDALLHRAGARQIVSLAKPWRTSDLLSCARSLLEHRPAADPKVEPASDPLGPPITADAPDAPSMARIGSAD